MIPLRHMLARLQWKARLWHLALAGALIGFLTGIVLSTGPLSVPVFLSYGLLKGAFLAACRAFPAIYSQFSSSNPGLAR